jgi:CheY-like chemotaxis protein/HPt (histidine-containing phosphotransfer) domain-containing protein
MDVQMPVMDGLEATRRIGAMAPALPVIGLTAHAMAEERARCLVAGMVDHVAKPVDIDILVAAIRRQVRMTAQPEPGFAPVTGTGTATPAAATEAPERPAFPGCDDPEIIDLSILVGRIGDDPAKVAKYATRFIENARPGVAEMQEAAVGDLPRLAAIAHRLKSTALAVGAMRFGSICGELQLLKASDDPSPAQAQVACLHEIFEQIAQRIESAFQESH